MLQPESGSAHRPGRNLTSFPAQLLFLGAKPISCRPEDGDGDHGSDDGKQLCRGSFSPANEHHIAKETGHQDEYWNGRPSSEGARQYNGLQSPVNRVQPGNSAKAEVRPRNRLRRGTTFLWSGRYRLPLPERPNAQKVSCGPVHARAQQPDAYESCPAPTQ